MDVYYGTIMTMIVWLFIKKVKPSRRLFALSWLVIMFILGATGWLLWEPADAHLTTRFGAALTLISTICLSGPILIFTLTRPLHYAWSIVIALLLPYPSMIAIVGVLAAFGNMPGL